MELFSSTSSVIRILLKCVKNWCLRHRRKRLRSMIFAAQPYSRKVIRYRNKLRRRIESGGEKANHYAADIFSIFGFFRNEGNLSLLALVFYLFLCDEIDVQTLSDCTRILATYDNDSLQLVGTLDPDQKYENLPSGLGFSGLFDIDIHGGHIPLQCDEWDFDQAFFEAYSGVRLVRQAHIVFALNRTGRVLRNAMADDNRESE